MFGGQRSVNPSSPIVANSTSEQCASAVGLPTSPGGSRNARFLVSAGACGNGPSPKLPSASVWFKIERRGQLKRVRPRLMIHRAAFFFRYQRVTFDPERCRVQRS